MSTARSLNKAILIGNLTRDPVLKETASGGAVCTFGLATNSNWKDKDGNSQERTEFHNVVAWGKLGEICANLLVKGAFVYIEGEMRTRNWVDEAGVKHYRTEVKAQDMKILQKGSREEQSESNEEQDDSDSYEYEEELF
ncbi:MAG: single-stranded DNA-binding protein [Candidatus Dojkabacteria bacterium]